MNNYDFLYKSVLSELLKLGASQSVAKNRAVMCLDDFKKGKFDRKPLDLIKKHIKEGKREIKNAS